MAWNTFGGRPSDVDDFTLELMMSSARLHTGELKMMQLLEGETYKQCPLLAIPADAIMLILMKLEPYDLCSMVQTCRVRSSDFCVRPKTSPLPSEAGGDKQLQKRVALSR